MLPRIRTASSFRNTIIVVRCLQGSRHTVRWLVLALALALTVIPTPKATEK